jgi:hypothetical protein
MDEDVLADQEKDGATIQTIKEANIEEETGFKA